MTMAPFDSTQPSYGAGRLSSVMRQEFYSLFCRDKSPLRCRATNPVSRSVYVYPSAVENYWRNLWALKTNINFSGGNSLEVTLPGSLPYIALLGLNTSNSLVWVNGTAAASPVAPICPVGLIPLCLVYCTPGMNAIQNFESAGATPTDGYILTDMRPFINFGSNLVTDPDSLSVFFEDFTSWRKMGTGIYKANNPWVLDQSGAPEPTLISGAGGVLRHLGSSYKMPGIHPYGQDTALPFLASKNPTVKFSFGLYGAEPWIIRAGLVSTPILDIAPNYGIYVNIYGSLFSPGNYVFECSNLSDTVLDTGVASGSGVLHECKMVVSGGGASVEVYIDGVDKGAITTNIPSVPLMFDIGSGVANNVGFIIDYVDIRQSR